MAKVKICGLSRIEDIEAANLYLPDFIGFVFAESKRQVSFEKAAALRKKLDSRIKAVGVFAGEDIETVVSLYRDGVIDWIQLHGGEDEDYISALREQTECPVIKACSVTEKLQNTDSAADYILFDGPRGGSGQTFNWALLRDAHRPYFLAGGLTPLNLPDALRASNPWCVDVSGGVETDGIKDAGKIEAFINIVRGNGNEERTIR